MVTNKLSKTIMSISGKTTWGTKDWAIVLLNQLATINWGLPRTIISDRDRKFVDNLWRYIFK